MSTWMSNGQRVAFRNIAGQAVTGTVVEARGDFSRVAADDGRPGVPLVSNDELTKLAEDQYQYYVKRAADKAAAEAPDSVAAPVPAPAVPATSGIGA